MVRCMMPRQRWPLAALLLKPMTSRLSHRRCWAAACWSAHPPPSASAAEHAQGYGHLQEVHSMLWLQLGNVSILRSMPRCIAAARFQSHFWGLSVPVSHICSIQAEGLQWPNKCALTCALHLSSPLRGEVCGSRWFQALLCGILPARWGCSAEALQRRLRHP